MAHSRRLLGLWLIASLAVACGAEDGATPALTADGVTADGLASDGGAGAQDASGGDVGGGDGGLEEDASAGDTSADDSGEGPDASAQGDGGAAADGAIAADAEDGAAGCVKTDPPDEVCDGVDNDCDGVTDDEAEVSAGPSVCDDDNLCTLDTCDKATGKCGHAAKLGCTACAAASECDDKDACTSDSCHAGVCLNKAIAGCAGPTDYVPTKLALSTSKIFPGAPGNLTLDLTVENKGKAYAGAANAKLAYVFKAASQPTYNAKDPTLGQGQWPGPNIGVPASGTGKMTIGKPYKVNFQVGNKGNIGSTNAGLIAKMSSRIVLSKDQTYDSSDITIFEFKGGSSKIAPHGKTYPWYGSVMNYKNDTATVPAGTPKGGYVVLFVADATNVFKEPEDNNVLVYGDVTVE